MPSDKMIFISEIPESLITFLGLQKKEIKVFRSKGLLAHLLKRKHYKAAKYLDYIPDVISVVRARRFQPHLSPQKKAKFRFK